MLWLSIVSWILSFCCSCKVSFPAERWVVLLLQGHMNVVYFLATQIPNLHYFEFPDKAQCNADHCYTRSFDETLIYLPKNISILESLTYQHVSCICDNLLLRSYFMQHLQATYCLVFAMAIAKLGSKFRTERWTQRNSFLAKRFNCLIQTQ